MNERRRPRLRFFSKETNQHIDIYHDTREGPNGETLYHARIWRGGHNTAGYYTKKQLRNINRGENGTTG